MPKRATRCSHPSPPAVAGPTPSTTTASTRDWSPSEEESYREHRSALDATLFPRASATLTFELDAGTLNLVSDPAGGDRPRD